MKILIVLSESPLNTGKIAFYCLLISFLVPELLRFKDLKNDQKMVHFGYVHSSSSHHQSPSFGEIHWWENEPLKKRISCSKITIVW